MGHFLLNLLWESARFYSKMSHWFKCSNASHFFGYYIIKILYSLFVHISIIILIYIIIPIRGGGCDTQNSALQMWSRNSRGHPLISMYVQYRMSMIWFICKNVENEFISLTQAQSTCITLTDTVGERNTYTLCFADSVREHDICTIGLR